VKPILAVLLVSGLLLRAASGPAPVPDLLRSTYVGGGGPGYTVDSARVVVRGPGGALFVAGETGSLPFPWTTRIGPAPDGNGSFVVKFPADGGTPEFSVFLGSILVRSIAVDAAGAVYLAGETGGYAPLAGSAQAESGGNVDAFVAKLRPDGSALDYFTFLGGSQLELALGVAVDSAGAAYVTGLTTSPDFPVTAGAAQRTPGGRFDAFVSKVAPDGRSFPYSTYLGGAGSDRGTSLAVDFTGRVLVAGRTSSTNFPAAVDESRLGTSAGRTDAFVVRLNAAGSVIERVTRIGGEGSDAAARIALPATGGPVILGMTDSADWPSSSGVLPGGVRGGTDLFVLQLNPELTALEHSVLLASESADLAERFLYLGGFLVDGEPAGDGNLEVETGGLAIGTDGSVLVSASTRISQWTGSASAGGGNTEVVAARLSPDLATLQWLTLLGGREDDLGFGIADDGSGGAWVVGEAGRPVVPPYFPTTGAPAQPDFGGAIADGFLLHLGPASAPPTNDRFALAPVLSGGRVTVIGANTGASVEAGEPSHAGVTGGHSVWWQWTAPSAGRLAVDTAGSRLDTLLAVYTGTPLSGAVPVAASDDVAGGTASALRFAVTAGTTYHVAVDGKDGATGRVVLSLRFSGVANDDFAERAILGGFPVEVSGDTTGATAETGDDLRVDGSLGGASVWWEWTAVTSGPVAVSVEGGIYLPALAVSQGDRLDSLTPVQSAGGTPGPGGINAREVTFQATAGARYVIGLDGYFGESGPYVLRLETGTPPPNDLFANRSRLEGLFARVDGTNRRATFERDASEPVLVLTNALGEPQAPAAGNTVWWTWTALESGRTRVSLTNATFDSRVAVYRGSALGSLVRVAAAEGLTPDDRNSLVNFEAAAGVDYQVQVDGGNYDGRSGTFLLTLALDHPPKILAGSVRREADDSVSFEVEGVPGRPVRLEAGTDLRNWTEVSSTVPTEPRFRIVTPPGLGTFRLFRLNSPPEP